MENKAITLEDVNCFLEQFKVKASVFGIIYRVRDNNDHEAEHPINYPFKPKED